MNLHAERNLPQRSAYEALVLPARRSVLNHRWGHRLSVDNDVQLILPPHPSGRGRLTDMSVSGAFVETDLEVPLLTLIRVIAEIRMSDGVELCAAAAYVVRRDSTGIGIEWNQLAPLVVRAILAEPVAHAAPSHFRRITTSLSD